VELLELVVSLRVVLGAGELQLGVTLQPMVMLAESSGTVSVAVVLVTS